MISAAAAIDPWGRRRLVRTLAVVAVVAALMLVLEWPTPKQSYSLSARLLNAARPPALRIFSIASRRPVRILCG